MPIFKGSQKMLECGRIYFEGDIPYGSVTNILNGFRPKVSNWVHDQARIGTLCHLDISRRYKVPEIIDLPIWTTEQVEVFAQLRSFRCMWKRLNIKNVIDVEVPIKFVGEIDGEEFRYAGTTDIIYKKDDILYLADIKTGDVYDYFPCQLAAYYQAAKDLYDIEKVAILHCDLNLDRNPGKTSKVIEYDVKELGKYIEEFNIKAVQFTKLLDSYLQSQNLITKGKV